MPFLEKKMDASKDGIGNNDRIVNKVFFTKKSN